MNTQPGNLKNNLKDSDEDSLSEFLDNAKNKSESHTPGNNNNFKKYVLIGAILFLGLFVFRGFNNTSFSPYSFVSSTLTSNQPSEDLLNRMGTLMEDMGYTGLTHDDLRELRRDNLTATYVSNVRALGFTDLSLQDAVRMAKADASSAFIAMMIELGYDLDVDDIVRLRNAGVTAYYTSQIHDLGYRDVNIDQLIRLQRIGVSTSLIEQLQGERGEDLPLEEIIRYRISNQ